MSRFRGHRHAMSGFEYTPLNPRHGDSGMFKRAVATDKNSADHADMNACQTKIERGPVCCNKEISFRNVFCSHLGGCMEEKSLIELKGIVIAAGWEQNGDVSAVDIAAYDETRYRIADDPIGCQLLQFIRKAVVIRGKIEIENRQNVVHVERFHLDHIESTVADSGN